MYFVCHRQSKTEAWQATCSSFLPKSDPKSVNSLFRSVPGSFFSSPNFPNCSSLRGSVSVFADHLRSHFSVTQPKTLRSRARDYLSDLRRATFPEESHSFFCSASDLLNFLLLPLTFPRPLPPAQTKVHRTLMICIKRRLNGEIQRIKKILLDNGYPKNVINAHITKKIAQFSTLKQFGPEKCPVYLRVS